MLSVIIALAIAAGPPGAIDPRAGFNGCLRLARSEALKRHLQSPQFIPFAKRSCAPQEGRFRSALAKAAAAHGARADKGASAAAGEINDTYAEALSHFNASGGGRHPN